MKRKEKFRLIAAARQRLAQIDVMCRAQVATMAAVSSGELTVTRYGSAVHAIYCVDTAGRLFARQMRQLCGRPAFRPSLRWGAKTMRRKKQFLKSNGVKWK